MHHLLNGSALRPWSIAEGRSCWGAREFLALLNPASLPVILSDSKGPFSNGSALRPWGAEGCQSLSGAGSSGVLKRRPVLFRQNQAPAVHRTAGALSLGNKMRVSLPAPAPAPSSSPAAGPAGPPGFSGPPGPAPPRTGGCPAARGTRPIPPYNRCRSGCTAPWRGH